MVSSLEDIQDDLFHAAFPIGDNLPDECTILQPPYSGSQDGSGHYNSSATVIATGVSCRLLPALGRFARTEGVLHLQDVSADYILFLGFRSDIDESVQFKITSSDNSVWVNQVFEALLVMDPAGAHVHLEVACNQVRP